MSVRDEAAPIRDGAPPVADSREASVKRSAVRGAVWTMVSYTGTQSLRLLSNLILSRLLFPAAFGQMTLVFTFITGLQMFSDLGTGRAIIQSKRGDDQDFLRTGWTIQCARGALLWIASCAIAIPVARFYEQPVLVSLIPVAGLSALIAGFDSTSVFRQQKHLRLERLTVVDLVAQLIGVVTTVSLSLVVWRSGSEERYAVWALVAGTLVSSTIRMVLTHTFLPGCSHRFQLDRGAWREYLAFGRWIFVSTLLTFFATQTDRLIFGKMIPVALLGVYSFAATIAMLPTQAVSGVGNNVVFPTYSQLAARDDFGSLFWRVRMPIVLAGGAIVTAMIACGPFLVAILYDERYREAGWMLQILSAGSWFRMLEAATSAALLAKARVRWLAAGNAAKLAGLFLFIPIGYSVAGFPGALVGLAIADCLKYAVSVAGGTLGGLRGFGGDAAATAGVAAVAGLASVAGSALLERGWGNFVGFFVSAVGACVPWAVVGVWYVGRARALAARLATADSRISDS